MSSFKGDEVSRALLRKGFAKQKGGDHNYYQFCPDGVATSVFTHLSHNGQEVNAYLQGKMAKQIGLKNKEFEAFVRCTLGEADLLRLLIERGIVKP